MRPATLPSTAPGGFDLVVLEAKVTVAAALCAAGLPLAVAAPDPGLRPRPGRLAKTDTLDARDRPAEAVRPEPRPVPDDQARALAELAARQIVEMMTAERNRRRSMILFCSPPACGTPAWAAEGGCRSARRADPDTVSSATPASPSRHARTLLVPGRSRSRAKALTILRNPQRPNTVANSLTNKTAHPPHPALSACGGERWRECSWFVRLPRGPAGIPLTPALSPVGRGRVVAPLQPPLLPSRLREGPGEGGAHGADPDTVSGTPASPSVRTRSGHPRRSAGIPLTPALSPAGRGRVDGPRSKARQVATASVSTASMSNAAAISALV